MSYVFIVCFSLIVYFSVSLVTKNEKTLSEKIFVGWVSLLAITVFSFFLHSAELLSSHHFIYSIVCDTHVLHGSFFYLYIRSFLDPNFQFNRVEFFHLSPFLLLFGLKLYFNKVVHVMDCYGVGCQHEGNAFVELLVILKFGFLFAYLLVGYYTLKRYRNHSLSNVSASVNHLRFSWINNIVKGVFLLFSLCMGCKGLVWLGIFPIGQDIVCLNVLVSIFILLFLYIGNSYAYLFVAPNSGRTILLDHFLKQANNPNSITPKTNDFVSTIEGGSKTFLKIDKFLNQTKPYLHGQYTVNELAHDLGISTLEISPIIMAETGKNYCDYMNEFRVKALCEKLDNNQNERFTIFSLAMDCGFASKTSYNRIFKTYTGMTPSEYRSHNS